MRPQRAPLHALSASARLKGANLRVVETVEFEPRGPTYAPALRLRRRVVAVRGGDDALVLAFAWVRGRVRIRILAAGACSTDDVAMAVDAGRRIAAVDDDPSDFVAAVKEHPILGALARRNDSRIETTPTVFEAFAVAIIEQLVTGVEARASVRRLWRVAGQAVPGTTLVAPPTAAAVKRVPMWQMHALGIGARRAVTLHNAAGRGAALERLRGISPEVALDRMQSLPGVGPWTANYVAKRALGWADAVPVGDFWAPFFVVEALSGKEIPRANRDEADARMLELLEPFRPHRARVAQVLEQQGMTNRKFRLPKIDPHRREPWKY